MAKLLTVIGATGTQGSSVIDAVLQYQHDSGANEYQLRALTRNPASEASLALQSRGVEVIQTDLNDADSVKRAFAGSQAIFAVTDFFVPFMSSGSLEKATEVEWRHCKNIVEAAKECATLEHFIWSTLPHASKISGGKYFVPHFDTKNKAEKLIKTDAELLKKTTFLYVGWYGSNFQFPMFQPTLLETSGKHTLLAPAPADTPISSIGDVRVNVGKFALAILQQPEKTLPGRYVNGVVEETTLGKMMQDWGEVAGKETVFVETSMEVYDTLWPGWAAVEGANLRYFDEFRGRGWGLPEGEGVLVTAGDLGVDVRGLGTVKDTVRKMIG